MSGAGRRAGLTVAVALVAAWGCGGGGAPSVSSSTEEVKLTGTVKVNGKPATGGQVKFNPANINRKDAAVRTGEVKPDGAFEVTTLAGENTVTVSGPEVAADPKLAINQKVVDVKAGSGPVNIDLP